MTSRTDAVLADLLAVPPDDLRHLIVGLGGVLHRRLVVRAANGFDGVVFSGGASPGFGDAFASFDGSSDYVRGDLTPLGSHAVRALTDGAFEAPDPGERFGAALLAGVVAFQRAHRLPGELVVLLAGDPAVDGPSTVRVLLADTSSITDEVVTIPPAHSGDAVEGVASGRQLAAVAGLLAVGGWLERTGDCGIAAELDDRLRSTIGGPDDRDDDRPEAARVETLIDANRRGWAAVRAQLPAGTRLAVGESFTFGRLARLIASGTEPARIVDLLYGWYDPAYKRAVGVPDEQLADERIAEPRTVELAAGGLIDHAPGAANLAIATSGWANNVWLPDHDGELRDFFSVALVGRAGDRAGETLRCSVTATSGEPPSSGRRELTRELGVTAALVLLLRRFDRDPTRGPAARRMRDEMTALLERFGDVTFAPTGR